MSKGNNSPGLSRFARVMRSIAAGQVPQDLLIDFGVIQSDWSLLTNTFQSPIPKNDYIVCKHVTLCKGDRVVVAWVQDDAVIIGEL